ncbi:MAG: hypothetical protein ATN31_04930 [Candidatus Epulonipiscioides saccharophilum]|nr:MAG: hypothetical protein ATN31_04930 [Epulopiscium sp. AS2M-Bin001]
MSFKDYLGTKLNITVTSELEVLQNKYLDEVALLEMKEDYFNVDGVKLSENFNYNLELDLSIIDYCIKNRIIPIYKDEHSLFVAIENPLILDKIARLKLITNMEIKLLVATEYSINLAYEQLSEFKKSNIQIEDINNTQALIATSSSPLFSLNDHNRDSDNSQENEMKTLLLSIIDQAINKNASDIHIETTKENISVRFRIDGRMHNIKNLSKSTSQALINTVKTFSNMDITNNKEAQDGYVTYQNYDLRVNTLPSINAEKIVMRLRKNEDSILSLRSIGFGSQDLRDIEQLLKMKSGLIIVTGPTGSGKSTTLASFLQELNSEYVNIVSIEDPVEIVIDGITQVNINERGGFGFEQALRGILRQDIDVLMIGELRDKVTTEIATRAALTGHSILSTLHTENSIGTIYRMMDMNISPIMIKETLKGVIAQRLLRKLCPNCKKKNGDYFEAIGCSECNLTGYKGRVAIFEILLPKVHLSNADYTKGNLYDIATKNGLKTLLDKAIVLAESGWTSLDEIENILGN